MMSLNKSCWEKVIRGTIRDGEECESVKKFTIEINNIICDEYFSAISVHSLICSVKGDDVEVIAHFIESFNMSKTERGIITLNTPETLRVKSNTNAIANDFDNKLKDLLISEFAFSESDIKKHDIVGKFYDVLSKKIS